MAVPPLYTSDAGSVASGFAMVLLALRGPAGVPTLQHHHRARLLVRRSSHRSNPPRACGDVKDACGRHWA